MAERTCDNKVASATPATQRNDQQKECIRRHIEDPADCQNPERRSGIPVCPLRPGSHIVESHKRKAQGINSHVNNRIFHAFPRGVQQKKNRSGAENDGRCDGGRKQNARDHAGRNLPLNRLHLSGAVVKTHENPRAETDAVREQQNQCHQRIGSADGCEGIPADKASDDHAVDGVVGQLKQVSENQALLEEYIRFRGALIELGKVGNAFTAELSNEQLAFKENGQTIAYISNQSLVITNAEIRNKLSLGNEDRGWFDFIPRTSGNLSIVWRAPAS